MQQRNKNLIADNSPEARDCVKCLLTLRPSRRLGGEGGPDGGMKAVMNHDYFKDIDWKGMEKGTATAPFIPNTNKRNASGFTDDLGDAFSDDPTDKPGSEEEKKKFGDYILNIEFGNRESESMKRSESAHLSGRDRQNLINPESFKAKGGIEEDIHYDDEHGDMAEEGEDEASNTSGARDISNH